MIFAAYHKAYIYIYICYFIKSAVRIPNTTCIRLISMIGLGLVGLMGLWQNSSHTSCHINMQCFQKVHYTKQMCLFVLLDLLKPIVYSLIAPCGIGVPMSNPI